MALLNTEQNFVILLLRVLDAKGEKNKDNVLVRRACSLALFIAAADVQEIKKTIFNIIVKSENGNPTNGIIRLIRNHEMDEKTSAMKLGKIAEDLAAYIDRKTNGATMTKVLVTQPVGLDDSITVIGQSRVLPDKTPNRLLVRSFVLPGNPAKEMAEKGAYVPEFIIGVDTKDDDEWDTISQNLDKHAEMIRACICHSLTEPDYQRSRELIDDLFNAFCLNRPRVCFTPHGVLPYLLRIEEQLTPDEMIQYMVRPIG